MRYLDVFTPDSIIAAAVPYGNEDPREAAYNNAAYALDRDDVHLLCNIENKKVFYIAAASEDFSAHMNAVTPLAASLPGMKGHQGDGAYLAISESGYAVVVRKGDELYSYVGDRQSVDAFIASHDVPTYSANDAAALPWEGFRMGAIKRAEKTARNTILIGFVLAVLSFLTWIGFASWSANIDADVDALRQKSQTSISNSVAQLKNISTQPILQDVYAMQKIIALTSNTGGFVNYFKIEKGGNMSWKVELPTFVLNDYIEQFGKGLVLRRDVDKNVLVVELPPKDTKKK
ncbi:MAG: hypothetical protein EYC62_09265 [Alphaproteobacteria bacterium]|nr:MAG: hypothetical protein EYC62_09265 [Alphaproteobacteria bacterium]